MMAPKASSIAMVFLLLLGAIPAASEHNEETTARLRTEKVVENLQQRSASTEGSAGAPASENEVAARIEKLIASVPAGSNLPTILAVESAGEGEASLQLGRSGRPFVAWAGAWASESFDAAFGTRKSVARIEVNDDIGLDDSRHSTVALRLEGGQTLATAFRSGAAPVLLRIESLGLTAEQLTPDTAETMTVKLQLGDEVATARPGEVVNFEGSALSVAIQASSMHADSLISEGPPYLLRIKAWSKD